MPDPSSPLVTPAAPYGTGPGEIKESAIRYPIFVQRAAFKIKADPLSAIKTVAVTPDPIREDDTRGETGIELTLKVTLNAKLDKDAPKITTKVSIAGVAGKGSRDRDYFVDVLDEPVIEPGSDNWNGKAPPYLS